MFESDIHTHTLASGHGTNDTIYSMAIQAKQKGLKLLGISDHGPATMGSAQSSYFRNLCSSPSLRCGIRLLYGVEVNILDIQGTLDLDNEVLAKLDYAIASLHVPNITPGTAAENTTACIHAMKNPWVKILGHPDDTKFPLDYPTLVESAALNHVALEINNLSLSPDGYRGDTRASYTELLTLCKKWHHPVILGSDSHGGQQIGDFTYAARLLTEMQFPDELVLNHCVEKLLRFLRH